MKITDCKAFGHYIQKRRKALGYTQSYISEVTGLSASFISNLENGKQTAELGKALYIAQLLGLDMEMKVRGE